MAKPKARIIDLSAFGLDGEDVVVTEQDIADSLTYTPPSAIALSVRDTRCSGCGSTFRENLGLFLETRESNGTVKLARMNLSQLQSYSHLPRRIDFMPLNEVEICSSCWMLEEFFQKFKQGAINEHA